MSRFAQGAFACLRPVLMALEPERAHDLTLQLLRRMPGKSRRRVLPAGAAARLEVDLLGLKFPNPLGLAAGFDKDGLVPDAMLALGFGFVEIGTVTPLPQPGNPRPRLFRLRAAGGAINRMGFNNAGAAALAARLSRRGRRGGIVGINIGANAASPDRLSDYAAGVARFAPLASYIAVNISSPNTQGLRGLQRGAELSALLDRLAQARKQAAKRPPLFLKVSPDLTEPEAAALAAGALDGGVDGLIAVNTTTARPGLAGQAAELPEGGLSGRPLEARATRMIARLHRLTEGRLPIIGVGGIESGRGLYHKILAGASLTQAYTALIYHGPGLIGRALAELAALLERDGFANVREAVGRKAEELERSGG